MCVSVKSIFKFWKTQGLSYNHLQSDLWPSRRISLVMHGLKRTAWSSSSLFAGLLNLSIYIDGEFPLGMLGNKRVRFVLDTGKRETFPDLFQVCIWVSGFMVWWPLQCRKRPWTTMEVVVVVNSGIQGWGHSADGNVLFVVAHVSKSFGTTMKAESSRTVNS